MVMAEEIAYDFERKPPANEVGGKGVTQHVRAAAGRHDLRAIERLTHHTIDVATLPKRSRRPNLAREDLPRVAARAPVAHVCDQRATDGARERQDERVAGL
jgi:hypothetical protein